MRFGSKELKALKETAGKVLRSDAAIIQFKFRKKLSLEAVDIYRSIFWNTENTNAKDALRVCLAFRENMTIIKTMTTGEQEINLYDKEYTTDGFDVPVTFHDINYIKWKIGYTKYEVPTAAEFMEQVKKDSMFKYYESMNLSTSAEVTIESGNNAEGAFDSKRIVYKNTADQQAKLTKHHLDTFIKAEKAIPEAKEDGEDFFDRLGSYDLTFDEEKIATVDDIPGLMDDVKEDMH